MIYHSAMDLPAREQLLRAFADAEEPSALVLTPALGGSGLNLVAANHIVILQKFKVLNEQCQAIGRIVRLGQQRTPTAWVVHCAGSIDDRAQELHELRAISEARIMMH
jgi:non-specific serine/threonine protein kinase